MGRAAVVNLGLWSLFKAIASGDRGRVLLTLDATPGFASQGMPTGASRQTSVPYFIESIGLQVYAGDTALHVAAAAYNADIAEVLIARGADVAARNRRGAEPLHAAATGNPGSPHWNPDAQVATIVYLIGAGADANAADKNGATPLHRASRTRCGAATAALLSNGADWGRRNRHGSTPLDLTVVNSGRGGSGSSEALEENWKIMHMLIKAGARTSERLDDGKGEADGDEDDEDEA
jgi:ankyrin repeat protein